MEYLFRFLAGGIVVSAFAVLGDVLRPKSFAGLFGAAPSVALATLSLALWKEGGDYVSIERGECELLSGNFENAESLIVELLPRGTSKLDQAAVYRLKVQSHVMKSENQQAVASALTCLRLFGIVLPAHPAQQQSRLNTRPYGRPSMGALSRA